MSKLVAQASIAIVPVAGSRYVKGRQTAATHTHAVRLVPGTRDFQSVVCRRVKLESLLDDEALADQAPLSCPECKRRLGL